MNKKIIQYQKYIWGVIFAGLFLRACQIVFIKARADALAYPLGSFDFQWDSMKLFINRMNPYLETLYSNQGYGGVYDIFYGRIETNQFPSLLCLLIPYGVFGPIEAKIAWYVSNIIFTIMIAYILERIFEKQLSRNMSVLLVLVMICGQPWQNCVGNGQHTLFSVCFFLMAVYLCDSEKDFKGKTLLCGLLLGMSFFKYTITAPLTLYLVYKRKYKVIGISLAMHMALTVASALWLGETILDMIKLPLQIAGNLTAEGFVDLNSFISNKMLYQIIVVILGFVLLYIVFQSDRLDRKTDLVMLSLLTIFSLIFVYHRNYDFFVMVFPLAYWVKELITNLNARKYGFMLMDVLFLGVIWIMFFNDTLINKIGISFTNTPEAIGRYGIICAIGIYAMLLYFIGYSLMQIKKEKKSKRMG